MDGSIYDQAMVETRSSAPGTVARAPGLLARAIGVLTMPRSTYAEVAARPRWLGVLLLGLLITVSVTTVFLFTEVGQDALLDQQFAFMERFERAGLRVPPEAYDQMEATVGAAPYWNAASQTFGTILASVLLAGVLIVVLNFGFGGEATFKQVYAVVAHAGLVFAAGVLFAMPINYARGSMASRANLALLAPFLDDTSFPARFLGWIDLFWVWWLVNLAIGLGVLYRKRTGPIATTFLVLYGIVALVLAAVGTFAGA